MAHDTPLVAQHEPPAHLTDPYVRRLDVDRALWSRTLRGRLPKLADYAVARALADYGNKDGSRCHPGLARLAADLNASSKSVQRSMDWLTEHGWITVEARGRRKLGEANVYRVTVPAPVAVDLGLWPADDRKQWMERPAEEPRRPASTGHRCPLKTVSSGHFGVSSGQNGPFLVDTGVHPPGSTTRNYKHHPALVAPPPAFAGGANDDDAEWITAAVEAKIGHEVSIETLSTIEGMLARGANRKLVVNKAVADERA